MNLMVNSSVNLHLFLSAHFAFMDIVSSMGMGSALTVARSHVQMWSAQLAKQCGTLRNHVYIS